LEIAATMTSIIIIGVVIALAAIVFAAMKWGPKPKKAKRGEKAEIMKQLLALSDLENSMAATAAVPDREVRPAKVQQKPPVRQKAKKARAH
jgi:hypothetical protein